MCCSSADPSSSIRPASLFCLRRERKTRKQQDGSATISLRRRCCSTAHIKPHNSALASRPHLSSPRCYLHTCLRLMRSRVSSGSVTSPHLRPRGTLLSPHQVSLWLPTGHHHHHRRRRPHQQTGETQLLVGSWNGGKKNTQTL